MNDRMGGPEPVQTLGGLGEFAVIDRLVADRRHPPSVLIGPGDDAALLVVPDGRVAVSTDMLVQDRHFRLDWSSPAEVGHKAIAQNAADIEAMGGRATAFVVAFGAPADTPRTLSRNWVTVCGRRRRSSGPGSSAAIWSPARTG